MSLILDALSRSEQERRAEGQAPGLPSHHVVPAPVAKRPRGTWLGAALVLLAVAALAALWLGRVQPLPRPVQQTLAPTADRPAGAGPVVTVEIVETRERAESDARAVASLYQAAPSPEAGPVSKPEPELVKTGPSSIDVGTLTQAARRELRAPTADEHPAPLIAALPQSLKDQIPTLFYRQHDWSSDPSHSRVNINGEAYRQGDEIAVGLLLVEILPNSIILNFRGDEFRLRALNSWVNL